MADRINRNRNQVTSGAPLDFELLPGGLELRREGRLVSWRYGERADRDIFAKHMIEAGQAAEDEIHSLVTELMAHLERADPITLITQVVFFFQLSRDRNDPHHFATRDALTEFFCGLAVSLPEPRMKVSAGPEESFEVFNVLLALRELFERSYLARKIEEGNSNGVIDDARFFLGLEQLFDRTEGYTPHLKRIYVAVFEPIRGLCVEALGFFPGHIPDLVKAIASRRQEVFDQILSESIDGWNSSEIAQLRAKLSRQERLALSSSYLLSAFTHETAYEDISSLVEKTGIPFSEIEAILEAFVCPFGCQPSYRRLWEENLFRLHPIMRDQNGFSVPLPWALLHDGLRCFQALVHRRGLANLEVEFQKARDRATEFIVQEELEKLFGPERVLCPVHYRVNGSWAEADALVLLDPCALIVESKAHSLTPSGRRGAPKRLKKKAEELLLAPVEQAKRLSQVLRSEKAELRTKARRSVEAPRIEKCWSAVVTFERVDPFSHSTAEFLHQNSEDSVWVVCLADFLMVTHLLARPSEFLAYVALRTRLSLNKNLKAFMEADLLAGFFQDRLLDVRNLSDKGGVMVMVDYRADIVNNYYLLLETEGSAEPPSTGVSEELLDCIEQEINARSPNWSALLERVFEQYPGTWKSLRNIIKKVKRTGTARVLTLSNPPLVVEVRSARRDKESRVAAPPDLVICV